MQKFDPMRSTYPTKTHRPSVMNTDYEALNGVLVTFHIEFILFHRLTAALFLARASRTRL